jgi:hypothetical protein
MMTNHSPRFLIPITVALFLGAGGVRADPLPEGGVASNTPDTAIPSDKAQPTPVMDQHDVPAPAAAPAETPKPPADTAAALPKNVEPVPPAQAFAVLGKKVHGPDGKDVVGSIIDVLVDDQGRPRAAIVDFGGFLGVGSRKIAVDWQLMKFHPADAGAQIVLDLDRSQIQAAPEYKDPTQPAEVVEPALAGAVTPADQPASAGPATPSPPATPIAPPQDTAAQPDAEKHPN